MNGSEMRCRGWQQEAALRMLENNLDPEVEAVAAAVGDGSLLAAVPGLL